MANNRGRHYNHPDEKYERLDIIGKGSFGNAILVRSKADDCLYVAKEINLDAMSDKDKMLAQNEVDILTRINHPNIIKYNEHYKREGILVIVMEYADGGDLYTRIQGQKKQHPGVRFSEDQVMSWFIQMLLAVKHLHDHRILHRDLKSANIFLTKDDVVKIGDFGFGKVMANTIAQAKTLCGTPYYFSPELCMGKPYNNKTDIWALGCILAEMCLCDHAYNAKNIKDLMKRVCKGTYQPLPSFYVPELHQLVAQMLTKDQVTRPNIKTILGTQFVQTKLRTFSPNGQLYDDGKGGIVLAAGGVGGGGQPGVGNSKNGRPGSADSESKRDAKAEKEKKEMEMWAARDEEIQQKVERDRKAEELKWKQQEDIKKQEEQARMAKAKADKTKMMNRDQLKAFLQGPPPEEVVAFQQKVTTPKDRPSSSHTANKKATHEVLDEFVKDAAPGITRRSIDKTTPSSGGGQQPLPTSNDDPFEEAGWQSIVHRQQRGSDGGGGSPGAGAGGAGGGSGRGGGDGAAAGGGGGNKEGEPGLQQKGSDEFGAYANQSRVSPDIHKSIMEHVNASLLPRPGTASREKRAAERAAAVRQSQELNNLIEKTKNTSSSKEIEDDFSDAAATMGSERLKSLLVTELGNDTFTKAYEAVRKEEDEHKQGEQLEKVIGKDKAHDLAPLFDKLMASEG